MLVCCCVNLKIEGYFTFLPPQVVGQQLASDGLIRLWQLIEGIWELNELEYWKPNKLQTLFLHKRSKENPASFQIVTSFWIKLTPYGMGHRVGMRGLTTTHFHVISLTQQFKSSDKTNFYVLQMICFNIIPINLNNME